LGGLTRSTPFVFLDLHTNGTPPLALDRKSAGEEVLQPQAIQGLRGPSGGEVGRPPHLALLVGPPMLLLYRVYLRALYFEVLVISIVQRS